MGQLMEDEDWQRMHLSVLGEREGSTPINPSTSGSASAAMVLKLGYAAAALKTQDLCDLQTQGVCTECARMRSLQQVNVNRLGKFACCPLWQLTILAV